MGYRLQMIISGLGTGGAQTMLYRLLCRLDRNDFTPEVISLTGEEAFAGKLREIDIPVQCIGMRSGVPDPRRFFTLFAAVQRGKPHLVQTWMYHADLLGGLAARLAGIPVLWNIRHSNLEPAVNSRTTLGIARLCAYLSRFLPQRIICCAEEARRCHQDIGYDPRRMLVIPNGFDVDLFRPDREAREQIRQELAVGADTVLIGLVGRYHPQKDHAMFIRAAIRLAALHPGSCFVLCGDDVTWENAALAKPIEAAGLRSRFRLLGRREDIGRLNAAFDIATSASCGEGFSNTIGEAMACSVPCVVTDAGDSAAIVAETGRIVPIGDDEAFAAACLQLLTLGAEGRAKLGACARRRIADRFSIAAVTATYAALYHEVLRGTREGGIECPES